MNIISDLVLDFKDKNELYFNLLLEEDFNFKTKNINIDFLMLNDKINVKFMVNNILDLKIAMNAIIKSLEIIDKTLNI